MSNVIKAPDIEFNRRLKSGVTRTYGHIYWRPFIIVVMNKIIIGKKHL